jgi:hypothetical protein
LPLYFGQIYPNAATGLLLVASLLCAPGHGALAGTLLGLIPWFHLGTWPLAMGALVVVVIRDRANAIRYLAPAFLLWGGLLAMHGYFWRAVVPPAGAYGRFSLAQIPAALPGLLLDQESGLLWVAPTWLVALVGAASRRSICSRGEALLLGGWLVYVSTFNWWFGGWSPTGRFLLPAVGLMVLVLGDGVHAAQTLARRLWLASGVGTTVLVAFPFFRFNAHDGTNVVLDAAGSLGTIIASGLPSVVTPRGGVWAAWLCVLGLVTIVLWRRVRHSL